ncbi:hypothetical protein TNCV_3885261 [Trichonephila clavipes]|nr:hypothetical protein TNCV_3885261 [Trichonephila clavipes]
MHRWDIYLPKKTGCYSLMPEKNRCASTLKTALMLPHLFFLRHPDDFSLNDLWKRHSPVNSMLFRVASHMWAKSYLNEKECQHVVMKPFPQYLSDKPIYSPPDGLVDTTFELASDVPTYCLQAPME